MTHGQVANLSPVLRKTVNKASSPNPRGPWIVTANSGFWEQAAEGGVHPHAGWFLLLETGAQVRAKTRSHPGGSCSFKEVPPH